MTSRVEHRAGGSNDWTTPERILEVVRELGEIRLDPATSTDNPVGARRWIAKTETLDGLLMPWAPLSADDLGLVFCNPPYGDVRAWANKAIAEAAASEIVLLVAARPGAKWYRDLQRAAIGECELEGRLRFGGAAHSAPFPSAVFYFGPRFARFYEAFSSLGHVSLNLGRLGLILTSSVAEVARELLEAKIGGTNGRSE